VSLYYVYKKKYFEYSENRGLIVKSESWERAKGIAMDYWKDQSKSNIEVEEIEDIKEGIICYTDYIMNDMKYN
jgi:hypothetical protein